MRMPPPGRLCKLCRRHRPFRAFLWRDASGRTGVTGRCAWCRHPERRRTWNPTLPLLRYRTTRHAVDRYIERVRPDLAVLPRQAAIRTARHEMRVLMATAPFETDWPEWTAWQGDPRDPHGDSTVGFLVIDADTLFLLSADPNPAARVVVTVLTRASQATSA